MKNSPAGLALAFGLAALVAPMFLAQSASSQNRTAAVATTASPQGPAESLPRPDFRFKGQIGRTYQDSDPPSFPRIMRPPKDAPNVLLILLDDVGFGQFSAFGGGVPSPAIEKLAARGLR